METKVKYPIFYPESLLLALNRIKKLRPIISLIYLSFMGIVCIIGVEKYLKTSIDPKSCLTFMAIIFGIYTLNKFTDRTEDFTNDLGKLLFFEKQRIFLFIAAGTLVGTLVYLLIEEKLNWVHMTLITIGYCYSFRSIPWYSRSTGLKLYRIKEIIFLKNISVALLWGGAIFIIPILTSSGIKYDHFLVSLLAISLTLSTFNNTLYDDILDVNGDMLAKIRTIPTLWGVKKAQGLLISLDILWLIVVSILFTKNSFNFSHFIFLLSVGIYPIIYILLKSVTKIKSGAIGFLVESDLLFFGMGLILLSRL